MISNAVFISSSISISIVVIIVHVPVESGSVVACRKLNRPNDRVRQQISGSSYAPVRVRKSLVPDGRWALPFTGVSARKGADNDERTDTRQPL